MRLVPCRQPGSGPFSHRYLCPMAADPPRPDTPADQASNLAKYSGIAFTMLAIIGLSTWAGIWLDGHFRTATPWFTLGLMLLGLFVALYNVIRSLTK